MERPTFTSESLDGLITREPLLQKAYKIAEEAHLEQKRDDGTPYIEHCKAVAKILRVEWGIPDPDIIAAGLLHDSVEDKHLTLEYIRREFGEKIAFWIDGVSKFEPPEDKKMTNEEKDRITYKKIAEWNYFDLNTSLIKLADNLHNTRTLSTADEEKRLRNALKTLNFYTPLAESLGMWIVKTELEDFAFKYADPENYERYSNLFNIDERTKDPFKNKIINELEKIIKDINIDACVAVRKNSLVRLKDKKEPFSNINDVVSFRVIVGGINDEGKRDNCGKILMKTMEAFKDQDDPSRFDNFYDSPKFNKYSAIQITLNTAFGAVEIAITSDEKEDYNNWGIISLIHKRDPNVQEHVLKIVSTPTGQFKFLPPEANGLDYAYLINKKLAAQAVSITIDGKEFPLETIIPNGAEVRINRKPGRIAPDREIVEQSRPSTKKKAEKQFLEQKTHEAEVKGKEIVQKIIGEAGLIDLFDLTKISEHADKLMDLLNFSGSKGSISVFYRLVKYHVISEKDLRQYLEKFWITKKDLGLTSILVEGLDGPDLLGRCSGEIGKLGGNIRWEEGGSADGKNFSIRFVVEKLDAESEKSLKEILANVERVTGVTIV